MQPPRPRDPKVAWEQRWTAKVRFKSTASLLLGESAGQSRQRTRQERPQQEPQKTAPQAKPAAPDPVKEGINVLRGIFGR